MLWDLHLEMWFCNINFSSLFVSYKNKSSTRLMIFAITAMTGISQQRCFLQALAFPRGLPKNCHGLTPSISHGFLLSLDFSPVQPKWSLLLLPYKRTKSFFQHDLPSFTPIFFFSSKFIFFLIDQNITSRDVETPKVGFDCINIKYLMLLQIHKVSFAWG